MKKTAILAMALVVVGFIAAPRAAANEDDLKVIKKAVQQSPAPVQPPGTEAKWLKLLVIDQATNKESVKMTVPLALVEMVMSCAQNGQAREHVGKCDIDLEALLKQLKSAGPMTMLEINDEGKTVKVWLE